MSLPSGLLDRFRYIGRDLFLAGAVSSRGGELSVRMGDHIITRRGSVRPPG